MKTYTVELDDNDAVVFERAVADYDLTTEQFISMMLKLSIMQAHLLKGLPGRLDITKGL
ncbi:MULTISPECIES: hypothetical protein [Anaerotruncus]|jgi:hypothetical protein|uniref:hypothetical protein n=1 Tax=Anaerotruncus TaxID=244127 RepID=UPI0012ABDBD5|nr:MULTISPECIES: hypothetical protein [Anaerotruncus]